MVVSDALGNFQKAEGFSVPMIMHSIQCMDRPNVFIYVIHLNDLRQSDLA